MPFENVTVALESFVAQGMTRGEATQWVINHSYIVGADRQLFVDLPKA